MRTTVTLDADVERLLKDETHRTRRSFKKVLNDAVRKALVAASDSSYKPLPPVALNMRPEHQGKLPSHILEEMEEEDLVRKLNL